jgi:hypothetical protein
MALDIDTAHRHRCAQSLGLDVTYAAFFSSEALSRNIWRPIALTGMAIAALIVVLEWWIRKLIINRRSRGTTTT